MKKTFIPFVLLIIVIGGCSAMNDSKQPDESNSIDRITRKRLKNMIQTIMLPFKNIQVRDIL